MVYYSLIPHPYALCKGYVGEVYYRDPEFAQDVLDCLMLVYDLRNTTQYGAIKNRLEKTIEKLESKKLIEFMGKELEWIESQRARHL